MKEKQKQLNIIAGILGAVLLIVVLWGLAQGKNPLHMEMDDGIQQIEAGQQSLACLGQSGILRLHTQDLVHQRLDLLDLPLRAGTEQFC